MDLQPEELRSWSEHGYFSREGLLGPDAAASVKAAVEAFLADPATALHPAAVIGAAAGIRGDSLVWLDRPASLSSLWAAFDDLARSAARVRYLGLSDHVEVQLARYPGDGHGYARHRDAVAGAFGPGRRITCIYYLNDGWSASDGGALRLHLQDSVDLLPTADRAVVFLSEDIEHEVLPTFRPRLALTAWYYA